MAQQPVLMQQQQQLVVQQQQQPVVQQQQQQQQSSSGCSSAAAAAAAAAGCTAQQQQQQQQQPVVQQQQQQQQPVVQQQVIQQQEEEYLDSLTNASPDAQDSTHLPLSAAGYPKDVRCKAVELLKNGDFSDDKRVAYLASSIDKTSQIEQLNKPHIAYCVRTVMALGLLKNKGYLEHCATPMENLIDDDYDSSVLNLLDSHGPCLGMEKKGVQSPWANKGKPQLIEILCFLLQITE